MLCAPVLLGVVLLSIPVCDCEINVKKDLNKRNAVLNFPTLISEHHSGKKTRRPIQKKRDMDSAPQKLRLGRHDPPPTSGWTGWPPGGSACMFSNVRASVGSDMQGGGGPWNTFSNSSLSKAHMWSWSS